jgi:hypothetical protein
MNKKIVVINKHDENTKGRKITESFEYFTFKQKSLKGSINLQTISDAEAHLTDGQ